MHNKESLLAGCMELLIQRYLCNNLSLKQLTEYLSLSTLQQQYLITEYTNYSTGEYKDIELDVLVNRICTFLNNVR